MDMHLEKIRHLESAMQEAENTANEYEHTGDDSDSHKMELIGNRDMYAKQLQVEMDLLETITKIDLNVDRDVVEFGSVVVTDMQKVFIAIGLGKITLENDTYYAISLQVPFYLAMKGLKKGDTFDFRGRKVKILDVF
jgi:transcription elongation GreA/GreB family factor